MVKAVNLVLAFRARMASILSRTSREAAGGARQAYALSTTEFARRARLAHAISNIGAQGRAHANVMRTRTTSRASLTASGRAISTKPRPYAAPTHAAITTTVTGAATRARHASACSTKDFSHQLTVPTTVRAARCSRNCAIVSALGAGAMRPIGQRTHEPLAYFSWPSVAFPLAFACLWRNGNTTK